MSDHELQVEILFMQFVQLPLLLSKRHLAAHAQWIGFIGGDFGCIMIFTGHDCDDAATMIVVVAASKQLLAGPGDRSLATSHSYTWTSPHSA